MTSQELVELSKTDLTLIIAYVQAVEPELADRAAQYVKDHK